MARAKAITKGFLLIGLSLRSCLAATLAAWWVGDDRAPQIMRWNETLGAITYSSCNGIDLPAFPLDPPNALNLQYKPRNGTSVTGHGWWNSKTTAASVFYQDDQGRLVNTYQECDLETGQFRRITSEVISKDAPSVHAQTGLASLLLSGGDTNDGYRVFYHDEDMRVNSIGYRPATTTFYYDGIVSQDKAAGMALAATFSSSRNYSVVWPKDSSNLMHARAWSEKSYRHGLTTIPRPLKGANSTGVINSSASNASSLVLDDDAAAAAQGTLPGWTADPPLAMTVDKGTKRHVFWLGPDGALARLYASTRDWRLSIPDVSAAQWPRADAGAALAAACPGGVDTLRLYYDVAGRLTELKFAPAAAADVFEWKTARALPREAAVAAGPDSTDAAGAADPQTPAATAAAAGGGGGGGLSAGATAGIVVGALAGAAAAGGAAAAALLYRRRGRRAHAGHAAAEEKARRDRARRAEAEGQRQRQWEEHVSYQQEQLLKYQQQRAGAPQELHGSPPSGEIDGRARW